MQLNCDGRISFISTIKEAPEQEQEDSSIYFEKKDDDNIDLHY